MRRSIENSQNFLKDARLVERLVNASSLSRDDTVLDIGAGSGIITRLLVAKCKHVIAHESDQRLATKLAISMQSALNLEVVTGDFLKSPLPSQTYKVFANIPFRLTSDIMHRLFDGRNPPIDSYLVMQREAALKFTGSRTRNSLFSVLHAPWLETSIVYEFKPTDFTPQPSVRIVLLRLESRRLALVSQSDSALYSDFAAYVFNHANPNISFILPKLFPGASSIAVQQLLGQKYISTPSRLYFEDWFSLFSLFRQMPKSTHNLVKDTASRLSLEASQLEKRHRTSSPT